MKKSFSGLLMVLLSLAMVACSQNKQTEKVYDKEFMTSLVKGLNDRWDYSENPSNASLIDSKKGYLTLINKELTQINKYKDLKFKDSKLKELALSYINQLEKTKEIANTFGSESFYDNWVKEYKARNEKLINIHNFNKIQVGKRNEHIFEELLASGRETKNSNELDKKLNDMLSGINFNKNEEKSDDYISTYEATVENTLDKDIKGLSASIKLLDGNGVVVDTQYLSVSNWEKNEKRLVDFMTNANFVKTDIFIEYKEFQK